MKVVIGYDGSESARAAIAELPRAGLARGTQVHVVSAADVWPPLPPSAYDSSANIPGSHLSPMQRKAHALAAESLLEAQRDAAEAQALVESALADATVSHEAYAGPAAVGLSRPELKADLVVVGAEGKSALGRMVLGSVSQKVLLHAPCSVRVSRATAAGAARADQPVRIVLGVDGSRQSALAVSAVAARAWPAGSEVKIVTVLDRTFWTAMANPQTSAWALVEPGEDGWAWALRAAQRVSQELRDVKLNAIPQVVEGDPKKVLLEEARKWNADCIFVGAKGLGAIERFLLGSVSAALAARAQCSVEVVRQG